MVTNPNHSNLNHVNNQQTSSDHNHITPDVSSNPKTTNHVHQNTTHTTSRYTYTELISHDHASPDHITTPLTLIPYDATSQENVWLLTTTHLPSMSLLAIYCSFVDAKE